MATAATHRGDTRVRGCAMGWGSGPAMFSSCKIADARRRMRHRRSTLNGGSARQVITHPQVNVGRYTPARSSRRHAPASTCSVSSRTMAPERKRAGSSWCSNGTRSTRRERPRDRTIVHRDRPPVAKLGRQLGIARDEPSGTRRGEHRDRERQLRRPGILEQRDASG